jgi:purine-nucleoside phosphorylase
MPYSQPTPLALVQQSVSFLQSTLGAPPSIVFVLGSGFYDQIIMPANTHSIEFASIPGFPSLPQQTQVLGHKSCLFYSLIPDSTGTKRVIVFLGGRHHRYEGYTQDQCVHSVRTMAAWGCSLVVTLSAVGSLHSHWHIGSMVILQDHINLNGVTPCYGSSAIDFANAALSRSTLEFTLDNVYPRLYKKQAYNICFDANIHFYKGVYCGIFGPQYETASEIRWFRNLGADVVGMSTVAENIALAQMSVPVLSFALLTNYATGISTIDLTHQEVIDCMAASKDVVQSLVHNLCTYLTIIPKENLYDK